MCANQGPDRRRPTSFARKLGKIVLSQPGRWEEVIRDSAPDANCMRLHCASIQHPASNIMSARGTTAVMASNARLVLRQPASPVGSYRLLRRGQDKVPSTAQQTRAKPSRESVQSSPTWKRILWGRMCDGSVQGRQPGLEKINLSFEHGAFEHGALSRHTARCLLNHTSSDLRVPQAIYLLA
ncbi:hypothetical protein J1614_004438 [Plenodomus biglobosus]|nr:hypothetical protein J1614_004438 [Plenodomus biglobosus]